MNKNLLVSLLAITLITAAPTINLFANETSENNIDILIQDGDLTITRNEALLMIEEMSWEQKQQFVKNEDKFQSILLDYLRVKKHEKAAKKLELDKSEIIKWKINKQNSQLLSRELIEDFRSKVEIPESLEAIALDYYNANPEKFAIEERVSVSHILLGTKKEDSEEKLAEIQNKANIIIKEIENGLDFEEAAKKYSDDKGSASKGGNINHFPRGQMVPPFEKAAFTMKKIGEISTPVKSRFGYHIIKLTGRIEASQIPFEQAKHALIKKEKNTYLKGKTDEFLSTFNASKNTTIYLPALQLLLKEESSKLVNPLNKPLK